MKRILFARFKLAGIFFVALALILPGVRGAENPPANPAATTNAPAETPTPNEALRAFLLLQEQVHSAQLSIERSREEAQAAEIRNAEALSNRLQLIEDSLMIQRKAEFDAMQGANHFMFFVIGLFAVVGFMAVLLTAYFQWRAIQRISDIAAILPPRRAMAGAGTAFGLSEDHLVTAGQVEQSNSRLFGIIERLEKRVIELEHSGAPALTEHTNGSEPASASASELAPAIESGPAIPVPPPSNFGIGDRATRITFLLDKGQMLLDSEQTEEAIVCFDEVLGLEPNHAEAFVKKGAALEKLRRPVEAIECYDRAIAADNSMTIAYLYKGGLCNRMERFSEAVECYEQALRTQERQRAA